MENINTEIKENSVSTQVQNLQFLTFTVGKEEFGVDIMSVREIKGWSESTRLPNTPEYMRGVMNLRGIIVPIFDLRARFSLGITEATSKNVVIIIASNKRTIGILVDAVSDILETTKDSVKAAPGATSDMDEKYIMGIISVDKRMVVVLEMERLFDADEIKNLENAKP